MSRLGSSQARIAHSRQTLCPNCAISAGCVLQRRTGRGVRGLQVCSANIGACEFDLAAPSQHDRECQGATSDPEFSQYTGRDCQLTNMGFLSAMSILVDHPWLTVVPTILFLLLFRTSNKRTVLVVALLWLAYLPYEYAMKLRILCSGECNIRVDLLLIYPALILISLLGLVVFAVACRKKAEQE
jgi:hypothetical protein